MKTPENVLAEARAIAAARAAEVEKKRPAKPRDMGLITEPAHIIEDMGGLN